MSRLNEGPPRIVRGASKDPNYVNPLISRWKDLSPTDRDHQKKALRSAAQPKHLLTPESKAEAEQTRSVNPPPHRT